MFKQFLRQRSLELSSMSIATAFGLCLVAHGICQAQPPAKKDAAKAADAEKGKVAGPQAEKVETTIDRWTDPRAEEAMKLFPTVPNQSFTEPERATIKSWAMGQGQLDPALIKKFVTSRVFQLADKKNIKALEELNGKPEEAKAIEKATSELLEPLMQPQTANNQRFRNVYTSALIDGFKPLWRGNLHSRTMAMIVLSRSGDAQAIKIFADQLADMDQLLVVKLLAAVGISNVAKHGKANLDAGSSITAANALSDFLLKQPDVFWPAQFRALEALGSLKMSTAQPADGKAEFAETAMTFLTDPEAAPDVRVWAGWALGMMTIPGAVKDFNYKLISHALATTAADLADQITKMPEKAMPKITRMTDLLIQLDRAFTGELDLRDTGLLHASNSALSASQPYVVEMEKKVKEVTKASVALSQAFGTQIPKYRDELVIKVKELRTALAKNLPTSKALYAGGAEYPVAAPSRVADGARP